MTSTKEGNPDLKSHQLQDISESATPSSAAAEASNKEIADTASSKSFQSINPADIPLSTSHKNVNVEPISVGDEETENPTTEPTQPTSGGGVFGMVRSIFGGNHAAAPAQTAPVESEVSHPKSVEFEAPQYEPEVTHETTLNSGTSAQVATAPGHTAVPESLHSGASPVGVAKTTFTEPVSDYAPALSSIAGEPEPSDPTKKYGHALDSLTGEAPVASSPGVISSVTHAASSAVTSAVDTVKYAVGYETHDTPTASTNTASTAANVASHPGTLTVDELPKTGRITPHDDGTIDIAEGQASSLAARQAETPTTQEFQGITGGGHLAKNGTTGAVTNIDKEVPKSGTVNTTGDGAAEIEPAPRPGIIASAVGSVAGGANYLKDSVVGLVGTGQAGDTSEQIAALDKQNVASEKSPVAYENESAGEGPYLQPSTTNQAGPVVQEKPNVAFEDSEPASSEQFAGTPLVSGHANAGQGSQATSVRDVPSSISTPKPAAGISTGTGSATVAAKTPASGTDAVREASTGPTASTSSTVAPAATTGAATGSVAGGAVASKEPSSGDVVTTSETSPLVKEVGPVASNATPESTSKSGKDNVRLPTGGVVEAEKPSGTDAASKAAISSPSSKPVVSAFAKPSTEAAKASAVESKAATEPSSSSIPSKTGTEVAAATGTNSSADATKPSGTADKATPGVADKATTGTADKAASSISPATDAKTSATKDAASKTDAAAKKEAKKDQKTCGCCTIS